MSDLSIQTVFDLPSTIPPCIVKIQDFDDDQVLQENIRDYVITPIVATAMEQLVERIVASSVRHEPGTGHYLHGSFGSGKSHFMSILGLILENRQAVWSLKHPAIQKIHQKHSTWLAEHPVLVVPVYMLGQTSLRTACYNAANARLAALKKPLCEFSDAGKVIDAFRADEEHFGVQVFDKFSGKTGISRNRFERMAAGDQDERDELAEQILRFRSLSRTEKANLYPDKFSDGMAMLTRHARDLGYSAVVYMIDELILYLTGKLGGEYIQEVNDLSALVDNSSLDRAVPLWVIVARQRNIRDTVPGDVSQQKIFDSLDFGKDRFLATTELADTELVPIVKQRVLRVRQGMENLLQQTIQSTLSALPEETRAILLLDYHLDDFRQVYPFHPALIQTLVDITARLSRERAAIRLLYELLILRNPDLPIGSLIPYNSLFDVVFLPTRLTGDAQNAELEAVRQTYYERLLPLIRETFGETDKATKAQQIVKTVLLCQLTRSLKSDINVERILHLNYQDLRGRTTFGSYNVIDNILSELDNKSDLVHFSRNPGSPQSGVVGIEMASGVQLEDVMKRISVNWHQRLEAFNGLMKEILGKPILNGEIPGYERLWRGTRRKGRVRLVNVADLQQGDMVLPAGQEMLLFIDIPFQAATDSTREEDLKIIDRARATMQPLPIGFWLPMECTATDLRDLEDYARLLELEANPTKYLDEYGRSQRQALETRIYGQKTSKARALRDRLTEIYKGRDAKVLFLDPTITPSLDAESLGAALDRVTDTVLDRLYPYHPRFGAEVTQRGLQRLLEDFMIPAALRKQPVQRNSDLDGFVTRLGQPLELAEMGATQWTLRMQSRYLAKLTELSAGKRVEVEKIRQGLYNSFGFTRELSDALILFLIRGMGYRALRGTQSVANIGFGNLLDGLTLEQGERLAAYEWANAKDMARNVWSVTAQADELTVAAQDSLWRQVNSAATAVKLPLTELARKISAALGLAGVDEAESLRLTALRAGQQLNDLAARADLDAYQGFKLLLDWKPAEGSGISCQAAHDQISDREGTSGAFDLLEAKTVERIKLLAQSNEDAAQAVATLQLLLRQSDEQVELSSHLRAWNKNANEIINRALTPITSTRDWPPSNGTPGGGTDYVAPELTNGQAGEMMITISTGGDTVSINSDEVQSLVMSLLNRAGIAIGTDEIVIRIKGRRK